MDQHSTIVIAIKTVMQILSNLNRFILFQSSATLKDIQKSAILFKNIIQESSRAALERYLFYYNRYHNHSQSLKKENKLRLNVKRKMDSLMERDMSWVEVQFLHQAVETLQQSRQILMFTYVFAFYLQRSNPTEIFETNQVLKFI